jgi:endoglucanase
MVPTYMRTAPSLLRSIALVVLASCAASPGPGDDAGSGSSSGAAAGRLHIAGAQIVDGHGTAVRLTGVNWFGFETNTYAPHGLAQRPMTALLDQIKALGFNVIRVPFSSQLLDAGSTPNGIDAGKNPELSGKTGVEILDLLIARAGERGLRIILDRHRPDSGAQSAVWYTDAYSEARWIADWKLLAGRYKDNPTVVAFDLHNEPHGQATWGDGSMTTDWRAAAQRAGNAILSVAPDALVIVEGIESVNSTYYWWGGNLAAAMTAPVQLSSPDHVIYSPHDYPASLFNQPWFTAASYPDNLPALWDTTWGNLATTAPVLVGEFGTKLASDVDRKWLVSLTHYIAARGLSFTFWSLNPDSGDTGGILGDDWTTVNQDKMQYLTPILAPALPVQ